MTTSLACANAAATDRMFSTSLRFTETRGWLHPAEGFALMELARLGDGDGAIVEIGSFCGLSTSWLAQGAKDGGRGPVYAVDTFKGDVKHAMPGVAEFHFGNTFGAFEENLRRNGLWDQVRPIVADSITAAKMWTHGPIRLLFIDAGHLYEEVRADFLAWKKHLGHNAIVAFHDYGAFEGVTRLVDEMVSVEERGHCRWRRILALASLRVLQ